MRMSVPGQIYSAGRQLLSFLFVAVAIFVFAFVFAALVVIYVCCFFCQSRLVR